MYQETPRCSVCEKLLYSGQMCNYDNREAKWIEPGAKPEHGEFGLQYLGSTCANLQGVPSEWLILP